MRMKVTAAFLALVLVCLAQNVSANRTLLQQVRESKLWKDSPLFHAAEAAKAGFECAYGDEGCNWVYSDKTGYNGQCVTPQPPPIPGVNANPTIAEYCGYYQTQAQWGWDAVYKNNTLISPTIPNGPMYGCIIGNNWQAGEARRLPGWAGKGFDANTGRFSNLVSVGGWNDIGAYPGRFYPTYSEEGGVAWTLDYRVQTGVPLIGGVFDFAINNLLPGQYIRNFGGFKDEIREIAPGMWLGRVYSLPMSLSWDLSLGNISPFTVYTEVPFLLFQGCLE
jgi:hypothetical protein